ncbi:MAG: hypothetical protein ACOYM7_11045 [Paludibacter sp.]|jgi:hypothetical protein
MKNIILRTDVSKLKKQQLLTYVNQTVEVVQMYEPELLHVNVMLQRLSALKPELQKLEVSYNDALNETTQLRDINSNINNALRAILQHTNALIRMRNVANSDKIAKVVPFVDRYIKAALPKNLRETINICNRMFSDLDASVDLQSAVTSVSLKTFFDEVKRLLETAEEVDAAMLQLRMQRGRSETEALRNLVSKAVSNLLNAIEAAAEEHTELDYEPLNNALNRLNTMYRSALKAKETRSKTVVGNKNETTATPSTKTEVTVV